MYGFRAHSRLIEHFGDAVGPVFCPAENQGGSNPRVRKNVPQQIGFLLFFDKIHRLANDLGGGRDRGDLYLHRIPQEGSRELSDGGCQRRRKKQGLALRGEILDDLFDVMNKSHIQHSVRLVQDKGIEMLQADKPLTEQIQETPGRRDEDIHTSLEGAHLRMLTDTSKDHRRADIRKLAVGGKTLANLQRQLSRGRTNQHLDGPLDDGFFRIPRRLEEMQNGQRKGGGFARPGLSDSQHILAGKNMRYGLPLNWCGCGIAFRRQGFLENRQEGEVGEGMGHGCA